MATSKYRYVGSSCVVYAPIGEILVNDKTTQIKLKYLYERGVKLIGYIELIGKGEE